MPEQGVVVEGHLGVQCDQAALARHDEWVDLQHGGVQIAKGTVSTAKNPAGLGGQRGWQAQREGDLPRLELEEPHRGLDRGADQGLGFGPHQFLDLHATVGRGDDAHPLDATVQHDAEVQLPSDLGGLLDVNTVDQLAARAGLLGHQPTAEHGVCDVLHLAVGVADLHATDLAAAPRVDLGLDHPRRPADLGAPVGRLLGAVGQTTAGDRHVEAGQDLLGVVLVDVQSRPLSDPGPGQPRLAAAARIASSIVITVWAIRSEAASIILPSTEAAPLPCASAWRSASMIRRARSTSASGGLNTSLASWIWLGWMAHLPSQPSAAARRALARKPSGSE